MGLLYITHFLNGFLMIAMPFGLAIFLARKFKLEWRLFWIGAATFILSQIGHIPFNWAAGKFFAQTDLLYWPLGWQIAFSAVFAGLSAGLFEEFARYAMYRWWLKDVRSWGGGLLAGAGHGGIESILLGAYVIIVFVAMIVYKYNGLPVTIPAEQVDTAQAQITAYWSLPWYDTLLGAVERLFAIPAHLALSLLVLQAFIRKSFGWVWLAVACHAVWDGVLVCLLGMGFSVYGVEAVAGAFAVLSVILVFGLRRPEPKAAESSAPSPTPVVIAPVEETDEKLTNTRYE